MSHAENLLALATPIRHERHCSVCGKLFEVHSRPKRDWKVVCTQCTYGPPPRPTYQLPEVLA